MADWPNVRKHSYRLVIDADLLAEEEEKVRLHEAIFGTVEEMSPVVNRALRHALGIEEGGSE